MDTERFLAMRALYDQALAMPANERVPWLWKAVNGDQSMFDEVMALIEAQSQTSTPPSSPPAAPAPPRVATAHVPPPPPSAAPAPEPESPQRMLASAGLPPLPPTEPAPRVATAHVPPPPPQAPPAPLPPPPQQHQTPMPITATIPPQAPYQPQAQAPPPPKQPAASMIGPYRMVRELGRGGMGVVYLAVREDDAFTKRVAVKLLRRDQVNDEFLLRFRNERQVLANLDHPNIARILDGGTTPEGMPYYVMEFCEGTSIDQYCGQFRLGIADRVKLFQQVCSAVHYLHENGVVHRDLKPGNILVSKEGVVKLLDFGIAKLELGTVGGNDLTGSFGRLMTPGYASPEQMSGAPITRSTDVYSLGVILYFLMTGELPYEDPQLKMQQVLAGVDPPKPSTKVRETNASQSAEGATALRRQLQGDLDHIIMKALQRDPRHRYETALAFSEDLSRYLEGQSITARVEPVTAKAARLVRRNRMVVALAAALVIMVGLGGWAALEAYNLRKQISQREQAVTKALDNIVKSQPATDTGSTSATATNTTPSGTGSSEAAPVPSPDQAQKIAEDVKKLRQVFGDELAKAWQLKPGTTPERKALVDRSNAYLKAVETQAAKDPEVAFQVMQTHAEVAQILESKPAPQAADKPAALESWNNAARVANQAAIAFPNDPRFRSQFMVIGPRIQALGGVMPRWGMPGWGYGGYGAPIVTIPVQGAAEIEARREQELANRYGTPQQATPMRPPTDPLPIAPPPPQQQQQQQQAQTQTTPTTPAAPAFDRAAYTEIKEKWFTVSTRVQTAEEMVNKLRSDLAGRGLSLHPNTLAAATRMRMALDQAKRELDAKDLESARESLSIAEGSANQVLKTAGR